jgi:hypothetical protein
MPHQLPISATAAATSIGHATPAALASQRA